MGKDWDGKMREDKNGREDTESKKVSITKRREYRKNIGKRWMDGRKGECKVGRKEGQNLDGEREE